MHTITMTDLARKTRQVVEAVRHGQATVVENHGRPEVVMLDYLDYAQMRAALRSLSEPAEVASDPVSAFSEARQPYLVGQDLMDQVMAQFLAGGISLGRAAEMLEVPWMALRERFLRLDLPVQVGPENLEDAMAGVETARKWAAGR